MSRRPNPALPIARDLARGFAGRADEADLAGALPAEDVAALRSSRYLGLSVPRIHGGLELSLRECVEAQLELARGSASTAMVAGMQLHIFGHQREQRSWSAEWFPRLCELAAGGALFNSVASEPALGSPSRGGLPATTATRSRDGARWILRGRKTWATGGEHLTHLLVRVAVEGERGVLLVPGDAPGVEWIPTWRDALSLRASDSHDVVFHDVELPGAHMIERADPSRPRRANLWFPMIASAVYLGAALAARDRVLRFAHERVPSALGRPIASLASIQRQLGEIEMSLQAARALLLEVAGEWEGDEARRGRVLARVAAAKSMVTRVATETTDAALRVAGGTSITRGLPLERHLRDVRAISMHPPAGDLALELVGRDALGDVDPSRS